MRIASVEAEVSDSDIIRLTLRSESGHAGSSESCLLGRAGSVGARLLELADSLIGSHPLDTEALVDRLLIRVPGRAGDVEATAVSLAEVACRNLAGQSLELPVYRLLGGAVRDRVKTCAVGWMPADLPQDAITRAARDVVKRGFRAMALEPFGPGTSPIDPGPTAVRGALRLAELVRAAVGPDVALRIDLGARLTPALSCRFLRSLERVDPAAVADPVRPDLLLPLSSQVPVVWGHRLNLREEFQPLLARRACKAIRLDLGRCGGFTEAKKISSLAESYGAHVTLRNLPSPRAVAAALDFAVTVTNVEHLEIPASSPLLQSEGEIKFPSISAPGCLQDSSADASWKTVFHRS